MSNALQLDVKLEGEVEKKSKRFAAKYPKLVRRTLGGLGTPLRNKFIKTVQVKGGRSGVPAWANHNRLTMYLDNSVSRMFGRYAERYHMRFRARRNTLTVGWFGAAVERMEELQESKQTAWDKGQRQSLYIRLGKLGFNADESRAIVSQGYNRPARPMTEPFTQHETPWVRNQLIARIQKAIDKEIGR